MKQQVNYSLTTVFEAFFIATTDAQLYHPSSSPKNGEAHLYARIPMLDISTQGKGSAFSPFACAIARSPLVLFLGKAQQEVSEHMLVPWHFAVPCMQGHWLEKKCMNEVQKKRNSKLWHVANLLVKSRNLPTRIHGEQA